MDTVWHIRDLGTTYDWRTSEFVTTYGDDRPELDLLRRAMRGIHLNTAAYMAGVLDVLRMPHVVLALVTDWTYRGGTEFMPLPEFLVARVLSIYKTLLAAVYGDRSTLDNLRRLMQEHRLRIRAEDQPDWFFRATNGREDFVIGEQWLVEATLVALLAPLADAHRRARLVTSEWEYLKAVNATIGYANGVTLGVGTIDELLELRNHPTRYTPMNRALIVECGVSAVIKPITNTSVGSNLTVGQLAEGWFTDLTTPDTLAALRIQREPGYMDLLCQHEGRWLLALDTYLAGGQTHPGNDHEAETFTVALRGRPWPRQ